MKIYKNFMDKIKKDKKIQDKVFIIDVYNNEKLNYKKYTFLDIYKLAYKVINLIIEFGGKRIAIILPK
jgi:acyl-coenzyme A synthetase/AMP-(fatty) acid ligase